MNVCSILLLNFSYGVFSFKVPDLTKSNSPCNLSKEGNCFFKLLTAILGDFSKLEDCSGLNFSTKPGHDLFLSTILPGPPTVADSPVLTFMSSVTNFLATGNLREGITNLRVSPLTVSPCVSTKPSHVFGLFGLNCAAFLSTLYCFFLSSFSLLTNKLGPIIGLYVSLNRLLSMFIWSFLINLLNLL